MVRGFEIILKGRDPRDAWAFTERACGVCTTVHALASVRTVEDALGITVPPNAELIRNLMFCAQYLQDHVVHFYHLHALDWVDVVSALKADPEKTSEIAQSISQLAEELAGLLRRRAEAARRRSSRAASSASSPTATGATRPTSCRRKSTCMARGALPRGARVAEGDRQDPHDLRRQEPAPELPGRRRALLDQHRRGQRHQRRAAGLRRHAVRRGAAVRRAGLHSRPAGRRVVLQGLGRHRRRAAELPGLRRPADATATATRRSSSSRAASSSNRNLERGACRSTARTRSRCRSSSPIPGTSTPAATTRALHPWDGETKLNYTGPKPPYEQLDVDRKYSWLKTPRWKGHADGGRARWPACSSPMRRAARR